MGKSPRIKSIAILNPLGDYGISTYCYELAEGLAANGVDVDIYTGDGPRLAAFDFPKHHRIFPVFGSALFKRRRRLNTEDNGARNGTRAPSNPVSQQVESKPASQRKRSRLFLRFRDFVLAFELAIFLKRKKYDFVWTHWPDIYGTWFWTAAKAVRLPIVHTVHNVLPHEESGGAKEMCREIYRLSDLLFVHSFQARDEFVQHFPQYASKIAMMRFGVYTIFSKEPGARKELRARLNIRDDQTVLLFCGAIRPYKNLDAVLQAIREVWSSDLVAVISGQESGYADLVPDDPLGRTRRLIEELGLAEQTRLLPGFLSFQDMAALCQASDVLLLAYQKHYGSGMLLLGMTLGVHVLATATGGVEEYLERYPRATLAASASVEDIVAALKAAIRQVRSGASPAGAEGGSDFSELQWEHIAKGALSSVEQSV
ncbi:MAG TPA: glycosyltransferase family 4 protein [Terriglobales bacterium]|nr:glycosyltransferase family 4 protein [Terriglobales bacterium]